MYKKLCMKCNKPSFSSCKTGRWLCPYCQNDLSSNSHQDAESSRPNIQQLFLIKSRYSQHNKSTQPQVSPYVFEAFDK